MSALCRPGDPVPAGAGRCGRAGPTPSPAGPGPVRRRPAVPTRPDPTGDSGQRPGPEKGDTTPGSPLLYFAHPASTIRNVTVPAVRNVPVPRPALVLLPGGSRLRAHFHQESYAPLRTGARGSSIMRTGPGRPCDSAGNASACRPGRAAIARAIRTPDRRIGARPPREPAAGRPGSAAGLRQRAVSARLAELLLVAVLPPVSEAGWQRKVLARRAACHPAAVLPCASAAGRRR